MTLRLILRKNAAHILFCLLLPLLFGLTVLSSCSTGSQLTASPTPTATVAATPPSLPRGNGEVLYLTNETGSVANVSGTFYASKPYIIFALCTGSGKLQVRLTPGGLINFFCSQNPQLQGNNYGNAQHPPTPENIQVQVIAQGNVIWEISIHLQA